MSQTNHPTPPASVPEQRAVYRNSKYQRNRRFFSTWALLIGLLIGFGGAWYYAYFINPTQEVSTRPSQLRESEKTQFVVAIMLQYAYDSDLLTATDELLALNLGSDPFQTVAEMACDLAASGYVDSTSGLRAVRAMRTFYQLQGRSGCADTIIPASNDVPLQVTVEIPTPTATLPPPPTKTPGPEDATPTESGVVVVPTTEPQRTYDGTIIQTFCDEVLSGIVEVRVYDASGQEVAGEPLRVQWEDGQSLFSTGLKPERGVGYADFQMDAGISYIISMPNLSDPIQTPLVASTCTDPDTLNSAITSYRISFRRN
ncbi:MAG: hypothetical protein AAFR81_18765 [Chloroflexota bacterium]